MPLPLNLIVWTERLETTIYMYHIVLGSIR